MLSGPEVHLRLLKLLQNSIISIRTAKITGEIIVQCGVSESQR